MLRRGIPLVVMMALSAAPAFAQMAQYSVKLNTPVVANQYLSVTNKLRMQGNANYTLEAWVYPTSLADYRTIFGNDFASSFWLGVTPTGHVRFYPTGGAGQYFDGAAVVPLNRWTHVAATYQTGVGSRIYVNGSLDVANGTMIGAPGTNATDLRLGADRAGTSLAYLWVGYLDEMRLWSEARSAAQIAANYRIGQGKPNAFTGGQYDHLEAAWASQQLVSTYVRDDGLELLIEDRNYAYYVGGDAGTMTNFGSGPPVADNTALSLTGDDSYASMPTPDGFADGLTIDGWIAPTRTGFFQTIVGRDFRTSFWLGLSIDNHLRFYPSGGGGQYFESNRTVPLNQWTHVAATYRPGDAILYINGKPDAQTTAFTAPVGENGRDVWAGADNELGVPGNPYPYQGYLDDVRVSRGVWAPQDVRRRMFQGEEYAPFPASYTDDQGVARETRYMSFGQGEWGHYSVVGPHALLVRSGAPLASAAMGMYGQNLQNYHLYLPEGFGGALPENEINSLIGTDLFVPEPLTLSSAKVFVYAQSNDLANTRVRVRSAFGTWVELVSLGAATGMDLHTVFADGLGTTLASGSAPYYTTVQPSQPMTAWSGQLTNGSWRLEIYNQATNGRVGLWGWGLQLNGTPVDAPAPGAAALSLANPGANPVRGWGQLVFTLPEAADVSLDVTDVQGRVRRELVHDEPRTAGRYAQAWNAEGLEPGVYFVRLRAGGREASPLKVSVVR